MALRNQPYLPLYVKDFRSDDKLARCSAASHGVYILLLCILHSEREYGKILLRQKEHQNSSNIKNFADVFVRMMPFDADEIENALTELIDFDVIQIDGDTLYQKRMVRDGNISEIRASAGKKGSAITNSKSSFAATKPSSKRPAKKQQNTVIANEYENAIECETNDGFTEAIKHFKEHRNKIKKPMTDHAVDLLKKDLQRYAPDNVAAQIEMIDRAIMKGWQTVYPIDEKTQPQKDGERNGAAGIEQPSKPPEQERRKFYYTDTDGKVKEGVR